jgi:hypothetical protein
VLHFTLRLEDQRAGFLAIAGTESFLHPHGDSLESIASSSDITSVNGGDGLKNVRSGYNFQAIPTIDVELDRTNHPLLSNKFKKFNNTQAQDRRILSKIWLLSPEMLIQSHWPDLWYLERHKHCTMDRVRWGSTLDTSTNDWRVSSGNAQRDTDTSGAGHHVSVGSRPPCWTPVSPT